jgi:LemA protein
MTWVALVVLAAFVSWTIASYHRLVSLQDQVLHGWRQVAVQLKRRQALIPSLVKAVRGTMDFERDTMTGIVDARGRAATATGPVDVARKEQQLVRAVEGFLVVAQRYPTLKANETLKILKHEWRTMEHQTGAARQSYNDLAASFNTAQRRFPARLFAGALGFKPAEICGISEAAAPRHEVDVLAAQERRADARRS